MKRQLLFCTLLTTLFVNPVKSYAQQKNVTTGNQQWVQYFNQTRLSQKWMLLVDGGFRWENDLVARHQYLVRAAGGYQLNDKVRVAAGFAHLGTYTDTEITVIEFRPHQELIIRQGGKLSLSHRWRVEQRFLEATAKREQPFERFNWRFRYFFGIAIPIVNFQRHSHRKIRFHIGDEIFINAGSDIIYNVFDQNRILIGPSFQLNESLTFALTYHGKFAALNLPSQYTYNHILWLTIRHSMDLSRDK